MKNNILKTAGFALILLFSFAAVAEVSVPNQAFPKARDGEIIDSEGGGAIPSLPLELVTERGISYISGGIGAEEEAQIKEQEEMFNFRLLITGSHGEFISEVTFKLKDEKGEDLLSINDAGPYIYLKIPSAAYIVEVIDKNASGKRFNFKLPKTGAVKTQLKM